jgi:hypothetical protein
MYPVEIETLILQMRINFSAVNYLAENVDVSITELKRIVFKLFKCVYTKNNSSITMVLDDI